MLLFISANLRAGGTPPEKIPEGWSWVDEDEDDDSGQWTAGFFDTVAAAIGPIPGFASEPEDEDDEAEQQAQLIFAPDNFIAGFAEAEDDADDEPEQQSQFTPALNNYVQGFASDDDDGEDEDAWFSQNTPPLNNYVQGFADVDDDSEDDELQAAFAQVDAPVAGGAHPVGILTRLGLDGYGVKRVGSFAGKTPSAADTGFIQQFIQQDDDEDTDDADAVISLIVAQAAAGSHPVGILTRLSLDGYGAKRTGNFGGKTPSAAQPDFIQGFQQDDDEDDDTDSPSAFSGPLSDPPPVSAHPVGKITRLSVDGYGARRAGLFTGKTPSGTAVVPAVVDPSAGGWWPTPKHRARKEVRAERIRLGILPADIERAAKTVATVAAETGDPVIVYRADPAKWNSLFLRELGATWMHPDYTRAIQAQIELMHQEDEEILLLM